jgi:hypothetical protein
VKRLVTIALIFVAALAVGQQVYYESTPTLEWDAVTTDSDGNPFLAGDTVEYEVLIWDMAQGDITLQPVAALSSLGITTALSMQLSFPYRSEWAVAVRTQHTDGGGNVTLSDPAYSVVEVDTLSGPFWYSPVLTWIPQRPTGLRDSGM